MTRPSEDRPPGSPVPLSLRSRFLITALAGAMVVAAGFLTLVGISLDARDRLDRATVTLLEEERIADLITLHVMDQMTAAFALRSGPEAELREEFERAGRLTHQEIRRYLFRDLSPEERLQLESMAEAHQRMEVAALRAADLFGRDRMQEAEASWTQMMDHTRDFLGGMTAFMDMRIRALEAIRHEQRQVFRVVLGASILLAFLVLVAAGGLGWMVQRRVTRPLGTLARASKRIGSGDLEVRVPLWPDRELHQLAEGFNWMAERLQETTGRLEERTHELSMALERLQETQNELVQAEKLSALGRVSAGLAHELNNPLTSVLGYSRLLEEKLAPLASSRPEELAEIRDDLLAPIVTEANRAQQLVRNLLHFTRRAEARVGPVDLQGALDVALALRRDPFETAGLGIEVGPLSTVPVLGERSLVQATFLTLVNNARDAMVPQGRGTLRIRSEEDGDTVRVIFEDEGPGLPDPERVFEPFYTTNAPGEGTGLGLSLVHRFMAQFGGKAEAESLDEGGARFILSFRRAPDELRRETDPTEGTGPEQAEEVSVVSDPAPASHPDQEPGDRLHGRPTILVVEDEAPIRKLHGRLLERMGARPLLADSAAAAREILAGEAVTAVLRDVKMPRETGLEFFRWIKQARPKLAERLLFVTGDVGDPELRALLGDRPDLFLHKPFTMEEFRARVRALLPAWSLRSS